jgi:transcriptional regulator
MNLYLPAHFNETRPEVMHALMRAHPLCTLVTQCDSGLVANHVPVQTLDEPKPLGCIRGHVARANPLWRDYRAETQALAIFQGPQVYISPSFYPSKAETGQVVPTWNYAVVHASGTLRFIQDAGWLRDFVAGLTETHEAQRSVPWRIDDAPAPYIDKMLSLIVGFEFSIATLSGKWKVSQNRSQADREGVMRNLQNADDADSHEMAAMLAALARGPESPTDR